MKRIIILMVFMLSAGSSHATTGNVSLGLGAKFLNDDWKPQETQLTSTVIFDIRGKEWPISIAVDYSGTVSMIDRVEVKRSDGGVETADLMSATSEFALGARKIWEIEDSPLRVSAGGGLAFVSGEINTLRHDDDWSKEEDSAVGAWVSGAIYRTFQGNLNFGLQLRFSSAEITLNEEKMEAGGFHILFFGGYHW